MTYAQLTLLHLLTVIPAFALGTWLLIGPKGTPVHRLMGKIYMVLMLATAIITLGMPAAIGPRIFGHFGMIHLFSLLTLYAVPTAYVAARRHQIRRHIRAMVILYVGGLVIAGSFAFMPGRFLHHWLFG